MISSHPIDRSGVWIEHRRPLVATERILFCDRDGVIIHDKHYLSDPGGVELIDGIVSILAAAEANGIPIVIVTNQSGIGRGYFNWDAFAAVQARMMDLLEAAGVSPSLTLACPHHPQARPPYRHSDSLMRKPNPGMLSAAASLYGIDPSASLMMGDKPDDMRAAANAGLRRGVLIDANAVPINGRHAYKAGMSDFAVDVVASVVEAIPTVLHWVMRR